MSRGLAALVLCLTSAMPAMGQLYFSQDVAGAVAAARRSDRPLMIYFRDRSRGCCSRTERRLYDALRDPRVVAAASTFIWLEASPTEYPATLEGWGISTRTSRLIVFASPDGTKLGTASSGSDALGLANAAVLARTRYTEHLWETRYKPALVEETTPAAQQQAALLGIEQHRLHAADVYVAEYLKRTALPRDLRFQAYRALAALSTETAVDALLTHAGDDKRAATALAQCNTDAVTPLLKYLGGKDEKQHIVAYRALLKICNLHGLKPDSFWSKPDKEAKQKEIDRVKQAARARATTTAAEGS